MDNVGHLLTRKALAPNDAGVEKKKAGRKKVYTKRPLYIRADKELRDAVQRLRKQAGKTAGVSDVVRSAILKAAEDLPK